jgi:ribosome-associated protein
MDDEGLGTIRLAPRITVADAALTWTQTPSGGPGGQHANKTASRVELRLALAAIGGLGERARLRLAEALGGRLEASGDLRLGCDETRSARRNRELILDRLRELVLAALPEPRIRRKTKPGRGAIRRRLEGKRHRAGLKAGRREDGDE